MLQGWIAIVDDLAFAAPVDEDGGDRRSAARDAVDRGAVDPVALQPSDDHVARLVVAERRDEDGRAAKARDGNGGIGGAPTAVESGIARAILSAARGMSSTVNTKSMTALPATSTLVLPSDLK